MELSDLVVFRTVVSAGGVTRAANQLHRVQSNVTTRVKNLEDELGVALFIREGRRMQLTPAGKVLLGYAERIIALASEAKVALRDSGPRGVLRLGAMESTAAVRLPAPLSRLQSRHRDLAIELHTGDPVRLIGDVLAGTLEAALVAEPVSDPRLASMPKSSCSSREAAIRRSASRATSHRGRCSRSIPAVRTASDSRTGSIVRTSCRSASSR